MKLHYINKSEWHNNLKNVKHYRIAHFWAVKGVRYQYEMYYEVLIKKALNEFEPINHYIQYKDI